MKKPMSIRVILLSGLVFGALGLNACTSGVTGLASYEGDTHQMSTKTDNFIVGMRLNIDDIKTTRVNDFLIADIHFRNKWGFSQDFKYRVHWFDTNGFEIEPDRASWAQIELTGKSSKTVKVTAPSTSVTNLKVTVRD